MAAQEAQVRAKIQMENEKKSLFESYKMVLGFFLVALAVELLALGWTAGPGIVIRMDDVLKDKFEDGIETDLTWIGSLVIAGMGLLTLGVHLVGRRIVSDARKASSANNEIRCVEKQKSARTWYIVAVITASLAAALAITLLIYNLVKMVQENDKAAEDEDTTRKTVFTMNFIVAIVYTVTSVTKVALTAWILYSLSKICAKVIKRAQGIRAAETPSRQAPDAPTNGNGGYMNGNAGPKFYGSGELARRRNGLNGYEEV